MSYAQARLWDEPEHPRGPTPIRPRRKPVRKIQPTIRNIPGLTATMLVGDVLAVLPTLPDESVHTVVTSPPYYGLRDYGTAQWGGGDAGCDHKSRPMHGSVATSTLGPKRDGLGADNQAWRATEPQYGSVCGKCGATRIDSQIGLEATPEAYIEAMVKVFREVRRVLRKDGTLWLNIGDSYSGSGKGPTGHNGIGNQEKRQGFEGGARNSPRKATAYKPDSGMASPAWRNETGGMRMLGIPGVKAKDLIGIPWMLAFALRADGWYLRSDIIWSKPNPMPESVTDRPTKAHEYLFLLTKSARYFYDADAIREEATAVGGGGWSRAYADAQVKHGSIHYARPDASAGRNKRSVWQVATAPFKEAHFATFPPKLVEPCIRAGTSEKGCCPECGAPWVRVVEREAITRPRPDGDTRERNRGGREDGFTKMPNGIAGVESLTTGWRPSCKHQVTQQVECTNCLGEGTIESVGEEGDDEWNECLACKGKGETTRFVSAPDPVPATVLDPFAGAATTLMAAAREGRHSIGIELNAEYAEMARRRLREDKLSNVEVQ